jgi:hypothetical protein
MAKILVEEDLVISALMCVLGSKTVIDMMLTGEEVPKQLLEESAQVLQEVLDATPEELRNQVIQTVMTQLNDLLEG